MLRNSGDPYLNSWTFESSGFSPSLLVSGCNVFFGGMMDQELLDQRYALGAGQPISQRFAKSPNMTASRQFTTELRLCHAPRDTCIAPLVEEACRKALAFVKGWFDYAEEMALDLWMAPEVTDLQYMSCQPCDARWFCAPGRREGRAVILFVSPLACADNAEPDRLAGCLGHEITHHLLEEITGSTVLTMKRKEEQGLPMWLEEGLCQVIQGDLDPDFRRRCLERMVEISEWYELDELWNDLSACENVATAYLQAYGQTLTLLDTYGKAQLFSFLDHSQCYPNDWTLLAGTGFNPQQV